MKNEYPTPDVPGICSAGDDIRPEGHCRLIAGLEQELNNTVTVMSGWLEWLEAPDCSEINQRRAITGSRTAINRLRAALRFMSKAPDWRFDRLAIIDLNEVVTLALQTLDPRVHESFEVCWHQEPLLSSVIGDASALDYVVVNLMMDAANAGVPGDRIVVDTSNLLANTDGADTGLRQRRQYVQLSVRTRANTARIDLSDFSKTGLQSGELWLPAICSRIVRDLGGVFHVTSQPDCPRGVTITLPACNAAGAPDSSRPPQAEGG